MCGMKMKRRIRIIALICGVLFLTVLGRALFVPLVELASDECFYCARTEVRARLLGIPVWMTGGGGNVSDGIPIPAHVHRMIENNGYSFRLAGGAEHRDGFGVGLLAREALGEGWRAHPERRDEMMRWFMGIDPFSDDEVDRFTGTYGRGGKTTGGPP
jgi:hypothetical protein